MNLLPTDVGGVDDDDDAAFDGALPSDDGECDVWSAFANEDFTAATLGGTKFAVANNASGPDRGGTASLCFLLAMGGEDFGRLAGTEGEGDWAREEVGLAFVVVDGDLGLEDAKLPCVVVVAVVVVEEEELEVEGVVVRDRASGSRFPRVLVGGGGCVPIFEASAFSASCEVVEFVAVGASGETCCNVPEEAVERIGCPMALLTLVALPR